MKSEESGEWSEELLRLLRENNAGQRRIIELLERQAREERTVQPGHAFHYEADGRTYQDFTHFIRANPGLDVRQLRAAKQEWDMQRGITKNKGRRPRI
jgi:hypothetical protein